LYSVFFRKRTQGLKLNIPSGNIGHDVEGMESLFAASSTSQYSGLSLLAPASAVRSDPYGPRGYLGHLAARFVAASTRFRIIHNMRTRRR